ncbi:MAG TPA: hypothetical protein VIK59_13460 [Verrucomicrobiae bacterium]
MKKSSTKLSPFLRFVAAGMLLVWVAAVTACSTECLGEDSHSDSAQMGQTASNQSHDSNKPDSHDDSLCVSLHSVCPTSPSLSFAKPDFGLAFTLDFLSAAQLITVAQPEAFVSRQPQEREWLLTPEVCLGPAFHSLAPPSLV